MRIRFRIVLTLLICVSPVSAQRRSTREVDGLTGPVRTVRLESFVLSKTTDKEEPRYGATIYTYDTRGFKNQIDHLTRESALERQILLTRDAENRLTEEAEYFGGVSLHQRIVYTYDDDDKTVEAAFHEADGSLSSKFVFKFNSGYDLDDLAGLQGVISFYREPGWLEAAQFDSSGSLIQKYTALNNDGWREITHTVNDLPGGERTSEVKTIHVFDGKGRFARQYRTLNGMTLDNGATPYVERTVKCEFDSEGNWTKRVFYVLGEMRIQYRIITYYH
jgi:hypothetical protein